jgi:hypothetical protein
MMKGETLEKIYVSDKIDNWSLIKTNSGYYSLRLGGFKKENEVSLENYSLLENNCNRKKIEAIFTDEEWVYIILDTNEVIASGYTKIDGKGNLKLGIKITEIKDYEEGFFQSNYMYSLLEGSDGWSMLI